MRLPSPSKRVHSISLLLALSVMGLYLSSVAPRPVLSAPARPERAAAEAPSASAASVILRVPTDYATIQAAVDAADSGGAILVAPGTYVEQVVIGKNLTLVGSGADATFVKAPVTLVPGFAGRTFIVEINNGAHVRMTGVTVTGPASDSCLTGTGLRKGIAVVQDATLDLSDSAVTHIHDTPVVSDCLRDGNAIAIAGAPFTDATGHATIVNVTISDYQGAGIVFFNPGTTATIVNTVITGSGPSTSSFSFGIDFGFGAVATITHNVISGNMCDAADLGCGPDPITQFQAAAIGPVDAGAGTVISYNTLANNDIGLYLYGSPGAIFATHNVMLNNRYFGLAIQDGDSSSSFDRIVGGQVGVGVIADFADTVGTLSHELIAGTSVSPIKEISCCGFTATAVSSKK
jgi:parallel beta helix pectate lyase-like protein